MVKKLTASERHRLATAPLPVTRRISGKTWAGVLIADKHSEERYRQSGYQIETLSLAELIESAGAK